LKTKFKKNDGYVREAEIRTASKKNSRPIPNLEVSDSTETIDIQQPIDSSLEQIQPISTSRSSNCSKGESTHQADDHGRTRRRLISAGPGKCRNSCFTFHHLDDSSPFLSRCSQIKFTTIKREEKQRKVKKGKQK
jgi:hypothetical protein